MILNASSSFIVNLESKNRISALSFLEKSGAAVTNLNLKSKMAAVPPVRSCEQLTVGEGLTALYFPSQNVAFKSTSSHSYTTEAAKPGVWSAHCSEHN